MQKDSGEWEIDPDLVARVAALPGAGQRWLKTALYTIHDFQDVPRSDRSQRRPRALLEAAETPPPPPRRRRKPADLEEVVSGRARLEDQLEEYPELAEELDGLSDVIDLLREAGQARRKKGEDVLRELGLAREEEEEE
jgi:hypothetical protein